MIEARHRLFILGPKFQLAAAPLLLLPAAAASTGPIRGRSCPRGPELLLTPALIAK